MSDFVRSIVEPRIARSGPLQGRPRPSGLMATIYRHELRRLSGGRIAAPAVILVLLMVLAASTASVRLQRGSEEHRAVLARYDRELRGATIDGAVEIRHPALKPPWRLSLVADGGQSRTPDAYFQALSPLIDPTLSRLHEDDPRLPGLAVLDWTFAIRVVVSLMAFLLVYDAVCGERSQGTLRLILSYPVSRWKLLAGKFLAAWSCLALLLLLGGASSLAVAAGPGGLRLTSGEWARAGLVLALGLGAAAFFIVLGLLVSSLVREPSTSLGLLALLWVTLAVAVPAVSGVLVYRFSPIPDDGALRREVEEIRARVAREHAGRAGRWRDPEWAAEDGYAWEKASALAESRRWALENEVRRRAIEAKLRQAETARRLARVSPMALVQEAAEQLAGTGPRRERAFLEQAWLFREALAARIREMDARDPSSPHLAFFRGYLSSRPLDPEQVPRFTFQEKTLGQALADSRVPLLLFLAEVALVAAAAIFAFSRSDAGGTR